MPAYLVLPDATAASTAPSVSSSGVSGLQACTCQRSTWSVPRRCSEPSSASSKPRRDVSTTRSPVRRDTPALVARTTSSRSTFEASSCPITRSDSPSPYPAAVSTRVPPASRNAEIWSAASCSSVSRPHVMVPSPRRLTFSPDRPRLRSSMVGESIGSATMRLAVNLGYWGGGNDRDNLAVALEADRIGYDSVWAAEAYGSDAATVLAWVAAQTERIDIGSAIFQIPARTPAMTAMTAATLDSLSGGRFRL